MTDAVDDLDRAPAKPLQQPGDLGVDGARVGAGEEQTPWSTILLYNLPTVGVGFMFMLVGLQLMKYSTDVLLMSPAVMGTIFGASRIWDAISDPIAGYLTDRTRSRLGRRRPWLLAAALPIGGIYIMLWSPPEAMQGQTISVLGLFSMSSLTLWMTFGVIGFYSAMTIFVVPHQSLGAEISTGYHDRNRIFGARHAIWGIGSMLALVGMYLFVVSTDPRKTAMQQAVLAAVVTAAMLIFCVTRLRERPEYQGRGASSPFRAYKDVLGNRHARLLLIVFLIENLGSATIGILTLYIAEYIIGTPQLAPLFILAYMVPSIASVPMWMPLAKRFGKKPLWMFSMVLTAFSFGGMFFLQEGSTFLITFLAFTAGTAAGCGGTVGPSVQADIIDFDEYETGERKEGAYFAAWNFVFKCAFGVTLFLTGWVLELSGFQPNVAQNETAKLALLSLYALYPLVCYVIGALIFARFELGEAEHTRIRAALDARRQSG